MVEGTRRGDMAAAVRARHFEILSGIEPKIGGQDDGPDPHELLEASLASCTILTVQLYAKRKSWPLVATTVNVAITTEGPAGTTIQRDVSFGGDLSDEQRQRLLEIADKCPIHRILAGSVAIVTTMV